MTDKDLITEARERFEYANEGGDFDDWEQVARLVPALADRLEAQIAEMHSRELHHFEEEQASARLKTAIREALGFQSVLPAIATVPRQILEAAVKGGQ